MRETIFTYLFFFLLAYVFVCVIVYFFQEKMLFFPAKADPSLYRNYEEYEITIKHGNVTLHGWLLNPGKSNLIIYYGGNAEEVSWNLADFKTIKNFSVLLVNYRGYGKSEGVPGQEALFTDALYIYDQITGKSSRRFKKIIVFGRSLGTGVATYVAGKRPVDGMILVTPYDSILKLAQKYFPYLPVKWILKHPFNSMNYVENLNIPSLVLVAGRDQVIPNKNSENLISSLGNNCKEVVIRDAGHDDIQSFPSYWIEINNFLNGIRTS